MVLSDVGELLEMFKNSFPFSFLFFIPIFIILSPVSPVSAAHEFAALRMQQYDLHGVSYGCRSSPVNMEARPVDSKMITRRCIVARLQEVSISKYRDLIQENAGALLVLLPSNLSSISKEDKQHLQILERDLLTEETTIPVYFALETDELSEIYEEIHRGNAGDQATTAVEALMSGATANGFQMVIAGSQAKSLGEFQITNIQGHLSGYGIEEQLPTVAVVAHYDSFGIAPSLAQGADANGSGVVALLELARLFSKLYTNSRTHAKFNLVFLLSGGGKFNYQGTKRWIEDNLDSQDSNLLSDVSYVLCIDSISKSDELYLHVSKPPKEDSPGSQFLQNLQNVVKSFYPDVKFDMVHKKINLAEDLLSWEHERFSIKRLPAFTLSHFHSHKDPDRNTILDIRENVDTGKLSRNIGIIAEALARYVYNVSSHGNLQLFSEGLGVQEDLVEAWLGQLTSQPRATQLLPKGHSLHSNLEEAMSRYLKDVRRTTFKADKRDPEFVFYDGAQYTMSSYNVKPAIFDLFLAVAIVAYLALVYLAVQNFHLFYIAMQKLSSSKKIKVQ
ncbi:BOS complex subunit ncln-like [Saccostrea echinata]|uniref:BOS complex subunit ncln-like n=1 Tax=Saccostrea echinata TaxID=191078 RepID=UPI002A7EBED0|nr:BOS complex subunit ncln-like [Saccostrea echinata]